MFSVNTGVFHFVSALLPSTLHLTSGGFGGVVGWGVWLGRYGAGWVSGGCWVGGWVDGEVLGG